jgi:hypothetical protein
VDRQSDRDALDREYGFVHVLAEIGLRQDDDRLRAALPRGGDVALEAAEAEVVVEPGQEEGGVDVRGEDLVGRVVAGVLAHEGGPPPQDRRDDGALTFGLRDRDPVADCRDRSSDLVLVKQPAGCLGPQLAVFGPHGVFTAVLRGDACGNQVVVLQLLECGRPAGVPPERFQYRQNESPLCAQGNDRRSRLALVRSGSG